MEQENEAHGINLETLILEVQKRTPIYDTSRREYHDRNLKKKLWNEICREVYSSSVWDSLSSGDKTKYGKEIQKRWNSLRHGFKRELATQKNMPSGSAAKKKKKYKYFDSLLFLLPFVEIVNTSGSIENDETEQSDSENRENMSSQAAPRCSRSRTVNKNTDEEIITLLREGNQMLSQSKTSDSGQDEDELFLRSLTSYMKGFSKEQKLLLRLEFLKLILNQQRQQSYNNSRFSQMNVTPSNETPRREPMSSITLLQNRINDPIQSPMSPMYNVDDSTETLEYSPQQPTSRYSNNFTYSPTPVHQNYVLIRSPENDTYDTKYRR